MRQWESLTSQVYWLKWFTQIYVPFVPSTEASASRHARVAVVGPKQVRIDQPRCAQPKCARSTRVRPPAPGAGSRRDTSWGWETPARCGGLCYHRSPSRLGTQPRPADREANRLTSRYSGPRPGRIVLWGRTYGSRHVQKHQDTIQL